MNRVAMLIDKSVQVSVSDPWEFYSENNGNIFKATVIKAELNNILIISEKMINFDTLQYNMFVCSIRLQGDTFEDLFNREYVCCNITAMPQDKISNDPFDVSWWRGGGGAMLGSISLQ